MPLAAIGLRHANARRATGVATIAALAAAGASSLLLAEPTRWSPYYKITLEEPSDETPFHTLAVNHDYHQRILDLSPASIQRQPVVFAHWERAYSLPYRVGRPGPVLIVGAGTGNDVAAALRHGARTVQAVEIDPTILAIGRSVHPERPYDHPGVAVEVMDARTYLGRADADEPFDIIVFGLLDSHTQVSGMNSLRLDNFVYTVESLREARALLNPEHGLLSVSFSAAWGDSPWTVQRIDRMLTEVFGQPSRVAFTAYDAGVSFLAGPGADDHPYFASDEYTALHDAALAVLDRAGVEREPATDDWPFLYMRARKVPLEQWIMMALIASLSAVWVTAVVGRAGARRFSLHFFLLGAAFLLIEVKNLVAFSLLFGSTWQVNNLAIGGILTMILLANLVASKARSLNATALYVALMIALVAGLLIGPETFRGLERTAQLWLSTLFLSIPIFCAGLVFIRSFARTVHPAGALGANIIGAICGGLLEYLSLAVGIRALQLLAIGLYALSWVALVFEARR